MRVLVVTIVALVLAAGTAAAQQPGQSSPPSGSQSAVGSRPEPGHMCPMMGGGMMGRHPDARMMQMRGEMMKAMGDIMIKYGKLMEGAPSR
jgi:hypothetical protein